MTTILYNVHACWSGVLLCANKQCASGQDGYAMSGPGWVLAGQVQAAISAGWGNLYHCIAGIVGHCAVLHITNVRLCLKMVSCDAGVGRNGEKKLKYAWFLQ